jgi:DNA polymerase I
MLIFDLETDGFLEAVTKVHVMCIKDTITGVTDAYRNEAMQDGLGRLQENAAAGVKLAGHNVINYDIPVLKKLYPWFSIDESMVIDTIVMTRLVYPDLKDMDNKLIAKSKLTKTNFRKHSLDAWGERLGNKKSAYEGDPAIADPVERAARKWESWNQTMEDYCIQDCSTTETLLRKLVSHNYAPVATTLEHEVAFILARQVRHGFTFFADSASKLYSTLVKRKLTLEHEIRATFAPLYVRNGKLIPKKDDKKRGYCAGAPVTKVALVQFNPGSRDHISSILIHRRGWQPTVFTEGGKPQIDDEILDKLDYPEAKPLAEYFMVAKRIAQIAEGDGAWLKKVGADGRMHGSVITNGAVTGRMTHMSPNMAQVPAGYSPYGHECRACFGAPPGKKLVGADASALELRDLAGYMAYYDEGAYIATVVNGKKSDGTEIHTVNMKALQITDRDDAKTWFYAFIYGAGDEKLGLILGAKAGNEARKLGKSSRAKFMKNLPALGQLVEAVKSKVKHNGYLVGLDGRILHVRSAHSALNTLLQSAGAIQMKQALVLLDKTLQAKGLKPGINYEFVANVHDEWQIECDEGLENEIGKEAVAAIRKAGEVFNFRCPLDGEYKVGTTWADTH